MICFKASFVFTQEASEQRTFYVRVNFDANEEDTGLRNQTRSYIKADLRQLGDIVFTDEEYEYELNFFVFEPKTKRGKGTGIVVVSVVITKPLPDNRPLYVGDTFKWAHRNDLRKLCRILVAEIDNKLIKRKRGVRKKASGT